MPWYGLVAWGRKRWTSARGRFFLVAALGVLTAPGCGTGEGRKQAVECHTDDDCDDSELGVCETAACVDNACKIDTKPDGHRCNDEDPLTGDDACLDGICAGVVKTCDDDLGPCLKAVHDSETDECTVEPVEDGVKCDDADACTQLDTCQAGACVGSEPKTCDASDQCHVAGKCDPESGECSDEQAADDGTPCDDAQACTSNDVCTKGTCGGEAVVCDDGLACSKDSCDEKSGACEADMSGCACDNDGDCDDHNACNGAEVCGAGNLCQLGTAVVCPTSADPCLSNVCVPETGECAPEPVTDGTACNDANSCTARDSCVDGKCVGRSPVVCTALSQCHLAGKCDPVTGACSNPEKPNKSACNDGNACTQIDTCQAGECVGAAPATCAAIDQCHDMGVCDSATGICSKPLKQNGVTCDDQNPCTAGDACSNGVCTPTAQVTCTALDSCHAVGTCDTQTGLCSNPAKADGTVCNDGLTCTTPDVCTAGKCTSTAVKCDDGIACTVDSCSEKLGGCTANAQNCPCTSGADCDDQNPCNGVETCNLQTLQCKPGTPMDCSSLNDACNVGSCSAVTGQCVPTPKANGTTCDDGNKCTLGSSCQAGVCKGQTPVVCTASDQCHSAGSCDPATGACSNPAKANGVTCNDGNACTQTDTCQSGVCTGSNAVVCAASDQCHSAGTCDTASGLCSNPAKKNGSTCDDSSACTQTDTCQGGVCVGASPVTCTASDQCHSAGTCDPKDGSCSNPAKTDGSACNDGTLCTQTDTCQSGVCTGSKPVVCTVSDQCHTAGTCDGATGTCSNPAKKDGTACNDSSACTKTDTCVSGVCTGSAPVTCTASDQCHSAGTCDPKDGTCSNPAKADGTLCNDGKTCTNADKCTAGVCGGGAITCDDKIACTVDSCVEPTGCKFDTSKCGCTSDAQCDDKNSCNGVETCDLGTLTCKNGTAVNCSNLDDSCNVGTCDALTGSCKAVPRMDGTSCDDGDACTKTDACKAGKCTGSGAVTCTASDQCHNAGSCDPKTGVCSNPSKTDGTACSDGNACTTTDTCQTGVCTGSNPVLCTALDQCHSKGICDTVKGVCSNPAKADGASCNDGDKCTQTDTCQTGVCKGSNPVVCTALDQCHDVGACASGTGTCSNPAKTDGTGCDDGNKCTQSDSCQAGACTGSKPIKCSALGQCYKVGVCDTQTGICSNPYQSSGTACDDTDACTTGEVCDGAGTCGGGSAVVCQQPSNVCLYAACNSTLGCVTNEQPAGTACDDGTACSRTSSCLKGQCTGASYRQNVNSDWADDPGPAANSVDIFTDSKANVHIVGTYSQDFKLNDKDGTPSATVTFPSNSFAVGIYSARYTEAGAISSSAPTINIGGVGHDAAGVPGTITVTDAAGNADGTFTIVGVFNGPATFGANTKTGKTPISMNSNGTSIVYVATFAADGSILWMAPVLADAKSSYTVTTVALYDDGSVIAAGGLSNAGAISFNDVNRKPFANEDRSGVWAARFDATGFGKWASIVVTGGSQAVASVTTHDDGGASLTGLFLGTVLLGPKSSLQVSTVAGGKDRDVWYQKLDSAGSLSWGGRVGGAGQDLAGDVARIPGGGLLLMANTIGAAPNAMDAKTTQQLYATATTGLQTHFLSIDVDGVMQSDALIANPEAGATRGWALDRDLKGYYAAAGIFQFGTSFYSKVGFGSGAPPSSPDISITGQSAQLSPSLFVARVDEKTHFSWGIAAGGDGSGMGSAGKIVLTAHPTHSVSVAGLFNVSAIFGDKRTEQLTWSEQNLPFVVHLNSEEEYDYCP
ncbi:MAG TPA: hypothetical protein VHB79_39380 [Polyangiaceae bacterium]|nr:hypothetical protein [Polyangiaceae bacterium]